MTFQQYSQELLEQITSHPLVTNVSLTFREIAEHEGHIDGRLGLLTGRQLFVSEYVFLMPKFFRDKYRYHVQDASGTFMCRCDNAPHHAEIETFPDHFHRPDNAVQASSPMDIPKVLEALTTMLT